MPGSQEQHSRDYYDRMLECALKSVVRDSLKEVAEKGFLGGQHFFITFQTRYPGVLLADVLRSQYANQMTIVLQHQFYNLDVSDEHFEVTLSFNKKLERLSIPFDAIVTFADPSVGFGLQFRVGAAPFGVAGTDEKLPEDETETRPLPKGPGEVISLDDFRKKT